MKMSRLFQLIILSFGLTVGGCHSARKEAVKPVAEVKVQDIPELKVEKKREEKKKPEKKKKKESIAPKVVAEARNWIGTRYKYGGHSRKGTDCSGMTMQVFEDIAGIKLPRDSRSQQTFVEPLKRDELAPGDLVFFASRVGGSRVGHVGIYIGKGDFIHASTSKGVIISNLDETYYDRHYHSSGRVPGLEIEIVEKGEKSNSAEKTPSNAEDPQISLDRLIELMETGKKEDDAKSDSISVAVRKAF